MEGLEGIGREDSSVLFFCHSSLSLFSFPPSFSVGTPPPPFSEPPTIHLPEYEKTMVFGKKQPENGGKEPEKGNTCRFCFEENDEGGVEEERKKMEGLGMRVLGVKNEVNEKEVLSLLHFLNSFLQKGDHPYENYMVSSADEKEVFLLGIIDFLSPYELRSQGGEYKREKKKKQNELN